MPRAAIYLNSFNVIWVVQFSAQKYSAFAVGQIKSRRCAVSPRIRGADRESSRTRGGERWTQKPWVRDELARRRTAQMRIEVFKIGMRNSNFEVFFPPCARQALSARLSAVGPQSHCGCPPKERASTRSRTGQRGPKTPRAFALARPARSTYSDR